VNDPRPMFVSLFTFSFFLCPSAFPAICLSLSVLLLLSLFSFALLSLFPFANRSSTAPIPLSSFSFALCAFVRLRSHRLLLYAQYIDTFPSQQPKHPAPSYLRDHIIGTSHQSQFTLPPLTRCFSVSFGNKFFIKLHSFQARNVF